MHDFSGRHLLLSLVGCEARVLDDPAGLDAAFRRALSAAGATVLGMAGHRFDPRGVTLVALLGESHASIHTYPEHGACFVDLFTCGRRVSTEAFEAALASALGPAVVRREVIRRDALGCTAIAPRAPAGEEAAIHA